MSSPPNTREQLAALKGRFEAHEDQCRERYEKNEKDHGRLFDLVERLGEVAGRRWWWLMTFIIASQAALIGKIFKFL